MKKYYLPPREAQRVIWLNNFSAKLAIHGATYGISLAEIAIVGAMALMYAWIIGILFTIKKYREDMTKYKNKLSRDAVSQMMAAPQAFAGPVPPAAAQSGIFTYIAGLVKRIKGHTDYDETIGEELGIIGDESTFDPLTAKTVLKGTFTANHTVISFEKPAEVDAVRIMSRRGTETDFSFLADDTNSPYDDNRPNLVAGTPEKREYIGWLIEDTHVIGLVSDPITVVSNII